MERVEAITAKNLGSAEESAGIDQLRATYRRIALYGLSFARRNLLERSPSTSTLYRLDDPARAPISVFDVADKTARAL
ncbi:hypothetical protein [Microvirga sesbaniae]|uniref:hypothetical protein n=1 Tax=Microvirga sesbaniae TaxID=681392 RepID=UPI0021CAB2B5|nr:hypothetical protein [Microvirga sp. HBU67692]